VGDSKDASVRLGGHESGLVRTRRTMELLDFSSEPLGQRCPRQNPYSSGAVQDAPDALGEPMTIREVAALIGCSVWTVRQRCLRQGLPHFRPSPTGKLIFYRNQVVRWLFDKQKERR
jgi:hypothetical protein